MDGLDGNIFFQQKTPDVFGAVKEGMSMGQMIQDRRRQSELSDAYKVGNGDAKATMGELARRGFGKESMEMQDRANEQDAKQAKSQHEKRAQFVDAFTRIAPNINDQMSYDGAKKQLAGMGYDVSEAPAAYDQAFVNNIHAMALSEKEKQDFQYKDKELESKMLDRKEARDERRFQAGIKMDDKMQGLKTPFGLANTEDDAKKLKEAHESKSNFDNKIEQMIQLRAEHNGGALLDREAVQRGKQLSKDLLLEYKNMAKLGVLSVSDEKILNAIIPEDPLEYSSPLAAVQGQDPIMSRLKSFQADSNKDFQTRINTRTRAGIATSGKGPVPDQAGANLDHSQAIQWAQANPNDPRAKKILQINQATAKVGQ